MIVHIVWTNTSYDNLNQVFKLQKRAARVILRNVGLIEERTVTLFDKLNWISFYDDTMLYYLLMSPGIQRSPEYLINRIIKVSDVPSRSTRFSDSNLPLSTSHCKETEGGKTFVTTASHLWNTLPISLS